MKIILSRDFLGLILSVAVVGLGLGATLPLTALALTNAGYGTDVVGLMTAMQAGGGLLVIPVVGRITGRFSASQIIMGAALSVAAATMLMQFTAHLWLWAVLRVVSGAALMVLFTIGEAWVNELADDSNRGRLVAVYATNFTAFQMAGPVMVGVIGEWHATRFIVCGAVFLFALPALALVRGGPPVHASSGEAHAAEKRSGVWRDVFPLMPAILVGTAFFALFDTLALSLMPLFAMSKGVPENLALLFGSAVLLGDTLMQFPIGWLADRLGRVRVHMGAALVVIGLLPLLPWAVSNPWLCWPLLFVIGAAAGSIYTLSLVACGERFRGAALVSASSLVGASWSIASFGGPIITGALMHAIAPVALIFVLLVCASAFLIAMIWEWRSSAEAAR
ncbi:MFS transporter permease [Burkholderia sp. Leaf177]|uniref:MFS transporter n=1 Tax=Burkholderia sp. Leaf177 TaxID=1736287 RepID=UPI0006FCC400|nr:MFS transporter permease [Burkholderia sp. Leaf177]